MTALLVVSGCAVEVAPPTTEKLPSGKADDGRPSSPDIIPDSYQLLIPSDQAPDETFSFCSGIDPFLSLPQTLTLDDAEVVCRRGNDCLRAPYAGEASDPDGFGFEMSFKRGTVTWSATVSEDLGPGMIVPGIYTVDVRLPELPSYGRNTSRGRRPINNLPLSAFSADYEIRHANGTDDVEVGLAPQRDEARWISLGVYRFDEGDRAELTLKAGDRPVPVGAARFRRLSDPNLTNAAWLSFFSANQYAHFWSLGPMLADFGFGYPGEGERWRRCAVDRRYLRSMEWEAREAGRRLSDDEIVGIGACVADWWRSEASAEARGGAPYSITSQFERYLVQVPDPEMDIQFFTGGHLDEDKFEFEAGSTQVLWAYHAERNMVVIAFRGTELEEEQLFRDVATDIDLFLKRPPAPYGDEWGKTHRGFMNAFREVEDMVMAKVETLHPTTQIFITGHSLGAAVATLLGSRIMAQMDADDDLTRYMIRGIYTFGSPRVGNRGFSAKYHTMAANIGVQLFRVRNASDIVTRIPTDIPLFADYEHVGPMLYIDRDGGLELIPSRVSWGLGNSIADHDIGAYYRHLEAGRHDPRFAPFDTCPEYF
ncbi:MAG: hypothetical protein AAGF12_24130 [Myxococcota bacterium]